ncbi:MAG: hypothetical protein L0J64_14350, partial [Corynebacterium sp.]|uniref:hypothetical protein n=1 Tax=Corynebacterium sp. TaxID=1720 RepID=UPI00264748F7
MSHTRPALYRSRALAVAVAVSTGLALASCSSDEGDAAATSSATTTAEETTEAQDVLPDSAALAEILDRAVDPEVPTEQKADTVEDGHEAAELFEVMTRAKQESGAEIEVIDPVLPGETPEIATASVRMTLPDQEQDFQDSVEFVKQDEQWKLSRAAACGLVEKVAADQVPPVCGGDAEGQDPNADDPNAEQDPNNPNDPNAEGQEQQDPARAGVPAAARAPVPDPAVAGPLRSARSGCWGAAQR